MLKIFNAYASQLGVDRKSLRFVFDGQAVNDTHTPNMLEMEDGDQLDAMAEQVGGTMSHR
jgi:small ubiquitin-related modifier